MTKVKWIKMRSGNPITGAILIYVRSKVFQYHNGPIEVFCQEDTDIDGIYRVLVNRQDRLRVVFVEIKHAAIVRHFKEVEEA